MLNILEILKEYSLLLLYMLINFFENHLAMISISCPYFKDSISSIIFGYSGLICTASDHLFFVNERAKTMMLKTMSSATNM